MSEAIKSKTPWHIWAVGAFAVLWNGFGLYDFVMSLTQGETYYRASGMSDALIAYYNAMPGWVYVPWAMGIGGAVIGTVLLLLRSRFAMHAFVVSLIGSIVSNGAALLLSNGAFAGNMMMAPVMIFIICVLLALYAGAMVRRGVLR